MKRTRQVELSNPHAVTLLLDPDKSQWLNPFAEGSCSLKTASEKLGVSLASYSYWLNQFLSHGILEVAHKKARHGRAVKYYQLSAEQFSIRVSKATLAESLERAAVTYRKTLIEKLGSKASKHDTISILISNDHTFELLQHIGRLEHSHRGKE